MVHRTLRPLPIATGLTLALFAAGCGGPAPPPSFSVAFVAVSDPGVPLSGVTVTAAGMPAGTTGDDGTVVASLTGAPGTMVPLSATCPEGHRAAAPLAPLVLRHTLDLSGAPATMRVTVACPPAVRRAVVLVRATGEGSREGIAVVVDGREVARTDRSGVAHVALEGAPGSTVAVMLATSTLMPELTPRDPVMPFTFRDADDIFLFDRPLEAPPPEPRAPRGGGRRPPPPETAPHTGPTCLSCR